VDRKASRIERSRKEAIFTLLDYNSGMSESEHRDGARVRFPPPLIFVGITLVGIALQRWVGALVPAETAPRILWQSLAGLTLLWGCWLTGSAFLWFLRTKQNPEPWAPSPELIVEGIYRLTRNPMYIGMAGWQMAWGFFQQNLWIVLLTPLSLLGVYFVAVRHEEEYLEEKFEEAFVEYKMTVRRWL